MSISVNDHLDPSSGPQSSGAAARAEASPPQSFEEHDGVPSRKPAPMADFFADEHAEGHTASRKPAATDPKTDRTWAQWFNIFARLSQYFTDRKEAKKAKVAAKAKETGIIKVGREESPEHSLRMDVDSADVAAKAKENFAKRAYNALRTPGRWTRNTLGLAVVVAGTLLLPVVFPVLAIPTLLTVAGVALYGTLNANTKGEWNKVKTSLATLILAPAAFLGLAFLTVASPLAALALVAAPAVYAVNKGLDWFLKKMDDKVPAFIAKGKADTDKAESRNWRNTLVKGSGLIVNTAAFAAVIGLIALPFAAPLYVAIGSVLAAILPAYFANKAFTNYGSHKVKSAIVLIALAVAATAIALPFVAPWLVGVPVLGALATAGAAYVTATLATVATLATGAATWFAATSVAAFLVSAATLATSAATATFAFTSGVAATSMAWLTGLVGATAASGIAGAAIGAAVLGWARLSRVFVTKTGAKDFSDEKSFFSDVKTVSVRDSFSFDMLTGIWGTLKRTQLNLNAKVFRQHGPAETWYDNMTTKGENSRYVPQLAVDLAEVAFMAAKLATRVAMVVPMFAYSYVVDTNIKSVKNGKVVNKLGDTKSFAERLTIKPLVQTLIPTNGLLKVADFITVVVNAVAKIGLDDRTTIPAVEAVDAVDAKSAVKRVRASDGVDEVKGQKAVKEVKRVDFVAEHDGPNTLQTWRAVPLQVVFGALHTVREPVLAAHDTLLGIQKAELPKIFKNPLKSEKSETSETSEPASPKVSGLLFGQVRAEAMKYRGITETENVVEGVLSLSEMQGDDIADTWAEQLDNWHEVIESLAEDYKSGWASVDPGDPSKDCAYCGLHGLCRV